MKKQKKNPLYKSFRYAFEGIIAGIKKGAEYEDPLHGDGSGHCSGNHLETIHNRVVHLPCALWSILALELVNLP